jgi:hypothetical protein
MALELDAGLEQPSLDGCHREACGAQLGRGALGIVTPPEDRHVINGSRNLTAITTRRICGQQLVQPPKLLLTLSRRIHARHSIGDGAAPGPVRPARDVSYEAGAHARGRSVRCCCQPPDTRPSLPVNPQVLQWLGKVLRTCAGPGHRGEWRWTASLSRPGISRVPAGGNPVPQPPHPHREGQVPVRNRGRLAALESGGRLGRGMELVIAEEVIIGLLDPDLAAFA